MCFFPSNDEGKVQFASLIVTNMNFFLIYKLVTSLYFFPLQQLVVQFVVFVFLGEAFLRILSLEFKLILIFLIVGNSFLSFEFGI